MKRDRLYGITLYLLNHGRTSASTLASHFEVSLRTIQRDMDALSMAKVPIVAYTGTDGGYEIQEGYRLHAHMASEDDYTWLATALQGLSSAMGKDVAEPLREKVAQLHTTQEAVMLDFSVLQEHPLIASHLTIIQEAIQQKRMLSFRYTNAKQETKQLFCEAVGCIYKWYSWYLLAYVESKGYRMYKLVRMENVEQTALPACHQHPPLQELASMLDHSDDQQETLHILLRCDQEQRIAIMEYLPGKVIKEEDTTFLYAMEVYEKEHFWFANILSFGQHIQVLEPESVRKRILATCNDLLKLYENYDIQ